MFFYCVSDFTEIQAVRSNVLFLKEKTVHVFLLDVCGFSLHVLKLRRARKGEGENNELEDIEKVFQMPTKLSVEKNFLFFMIICLILHIIQL